MPTLSLSDVGSLGYIADLPAHDLSENPLAWSVARNFVFRGGQAERAPGYKSAFGTVQQIPYFMLGATQADGTLYVVAASTGKVHSYTGTTNRDITKAATTYGASADTRWTGGEITGFIVLNNSVDNPQYIAVSALGSGNLADLTNWPASTTAKWLRPFKYFLVAGNTTETATNYSRKIRWSNSAQPGALPTSWSALATNDAGSIDLSGTKGASVDAEPLGDQLIIYREYGLTAMRYVGGTDSANRLVMAFNDIDLTGPVGILANNCVAAVPGIGHAVLSPSDFYVFNGSSSKSVLSNRWRRTLFDTMDVGNKKRAFVVANSSADEVWICFPSSGSTSCDKALIWNYRDDTLGYYDLPTATCGLSYPVTSGTGTTWTNIATTWTSETQSWGGISGDTGAARLVLGSTATKMYLIDGTNDADGSTFTAQLDRTGISFGDPERVKYLRSIWPRFDGSAGQAIEVTVGASMWPGESYTYGTPSTFTIGSSTHIDLDVAGRFFALRLRSSSGSRWRLRAADFDGSLMGNY